MPPGRCGLWMGTVNEGLPESPRAVGACGQEAPSSSQNSGRSYGRRKGELVCGGQGWRQTGHGPLEELKGSRL